MKLGGTNNETNLVASCQLCNAGKAATNIVAIRKTFPGWLLAQRGREDPVGDLADDERYDISTEPDSYKELSEFLRKRSACYPVLRAAWHAWREWKRGGLMTRATREAHAEMRADLRKNATDDDSCYWTKSGFWVNGKFFPIQAIVRNTRNEPMTYKCQDCRKPVSREKSDDFCQCSQYERHEIRQMVQAAPGYVLVWVMDDEPKYHTSPLEFWGIVSTTTVHQAKDGRELRRETEHGNVIPLSFGYDGDDLRRGSGGYYTVQDSSNFIGVFTQDDFERRLKIENAKSTLPKSDATRF